jgi:hypothetical protein
MILSVIGQPVPLRLGLQDEKINSATSTTRQNKATFFIPLNFKDVVVFDKYLANIRIICL